MQPKNREVRGIFGTSGSGKTYLAAKMFGKESRAICYNFMHDPQFSVRATHIVNGDEKAAAQLGEFFKWAKKNNESFRIDFAPTDMSEEEILSFDRVCFEVYRSKIEMSLYVDELHMLTNAGWSPKELKDITFTGRHREISIIYMAQRFASIDKKITYQTQIFDFFQTDEPTDLKGIADRCGADVAAEVQSLRRLDTTKKPIIVPECYEYNAVTRIGKRFLP